eukprot:5792486-Heterocapsa_arctica.AAC.1
MYHSAVREFFDWAREHHWRLHDKAALALAMSNFLAYLYENSEAVWESRTAVYGHQKIHCVANTRSLTGWKPLATGGTISPVAEEIFFWLANWGV